MKLPQAFEKHLNCTTGQDLQAYYAFMQEEIAILQAKIKMAKKLAKEYKINLK